MQKLTPEIIQTLRMALTDASNSHIKELRRMSDLAGERRDSAFLEMNEKLIDETIERYKTATKWVYQLKPE